MDNEIKRGKKRNITHIILGKPLHSRIRDVLQGSLVDKIIRNGQGIIVQVIPGKTYKEKGTEFKSLVKEKITFLRYFQVLLLIAVMTFIFRPFGALLGTVNVAMIFLLPVLYFAATSGRSLAIAAASLGILAFDFFFVPPPHTFRVEDLRYVLSFAIFLLVAVLTSTLATRLRHQVLSSRKREETMQALYSLSREIAAKTELSHVLEIAAKRVADSVDGQVQIMLPDNKGALVPAACSSISECDFPDTQELAVAMWVYENSQMAGKGTETLAGSRGTYIPLLTEQRVVGVMAVIISGKEPFLSDEQPRLLEAFASLTAVAINRIHLAEKARENQLLAETERLYTALFNCLSHDLRTPLTSITGAVTGLLEENEVYGPGEKQELLQAIRQGAARMNRLVNNLLDMARLESGVLRLNKEWCDVQEIISVAVGQLEPQRRELLQLDIEPSLPFVRLDFVLIEQVLVNLLDNAFKYSEYSKVAVSVRLGEGFIEVAVSDQGTGIPEEELERVFDKFYRLRASRQVSGTGLGLTICKSIIEAHGGIIKARNNPERGTTISFNLPLDEKQPGSIPAARRGDERGR